MEGRKLPVASSLFPFSLANKQFSDSEFYSQKFLNYYIEDVTHLVYEIKFLGIIVSPFVSCIQVSWIYQVSDNRE